MFTRLAELCAWRSVTASPEAVFPTIEEVPYGLAGNAALRALSVGQSYRVFAPARRRIKRRWVQVPTSSLAPGQGCLLIRQAGTGVLVYEIGPYGGQFVTSCGAALEVEALAGPVSFLAAEEYFLE